MKYEYIEDTLKIAKFMGITPIKGVSKHDGGIYYYYNNTEMQDFEALPFYNTFNELMSVVIKIESINENENIFNIFGKSVKIMNKEFVCETKIESIREAVVWWISQYNI